MISEKERVLTIETIIKGAQKLEDVETKILDLINEFETVKALMAKAFANVSQDIQKQVTVYIVRDKMAKFRKVRDLIGKMEGSTAVVMRNSKDIKNLKDVVVTSSATWEKAPSFFTEIPNKATPFLILCEANSEVFKKDFKDYIGKMFIILTKEEYEGNQELAAELEKYNFLVEQIKEL